MSRASYKKVISILSLKKWNDVKFQPLLTLNIWKSNYRTVKSVLKMEEWDEKKYNHLLTPSALSLSKNKIRQSISLAKKFNIDGHITVNFMRKSLQQVYAIATYLQNLNIPLITEAYKLHPFFSDSTTDMKKKYNIDLKALTKAYSMPNDFLDSHLMPKML